MIEFAYAPLSSYECNILAPCHISPCFILPFLYCLCVLRQVASKGSVAGSVAASGSRGGPRAMGAPLEPAPQVEVKEISVKQVTSVNLAQVCAHM